MLSCSQDDKRPRPFPRGRGRAYSPKQLKRLGTEFTANRYLSRERRRLLCSDLGLSKNQLQNWFRNKRKTLKKSTGDEDTRDADNVKDTVDEASNDDNWHSDVSDMQQQLEIVSKKELLYSEDILDDKEFNKSLDLELMDDENIADMGGSELNELNNSMESLLEIDKSGVEWNNKQKETDENTETLDKTIDGGEGVRSIQEQLLLMMNMKREKTECKSLRMKTCLEKIAPTLP